MEFPLGPPTKHILNRINCFWQTNLGNVGVGSIPFIIMNESGPCSKCLPHVLLFY